MAPASLVFVALLLVPGAAMAELPFTHFTPEAGPARLPSSSVQKVAQDRLGYVWMGFFSTGLARYDGRSIVNWSVSDGLGDLTVRDFIEDASGRLWVTSETGVVATVKPLGDLAPGERARFTTKFGATEIPGERMGRNQMALLPDGRLAIATRKGVDTYRFSKDAVLEHSKLNAGDEGGASILASGPSGALWVAFEDGSFGRGASGSDRISTWRDPQLSATLVSALFERVPGELWAGTVSGELWLSTGEGKPFALVSSELHERIPAITAVGNELWVASLGSGVLRLDATAPANRVRFDRADGFLSNTIWSIVTDREGNLWFAQNGGLSRLRADYRAFTTLTASRRNDHEPALPAPECFAVVPPAASDGVNSWSWIATAAGVAVRDREGRSAVVAQKEGLLSGSVYSLSRDGRGRIWVGTAAGLNAIVLDGAAEPGGLTATQPVEILGHKATIVSFIALDPERIYSCRVLSVPAGEKREEVVFTAGSSGVRCFVDGTWLDVDAEAGRGAAYDVAIDARGFLWVATPQRGVQRSEGPISMSRLQQKLAGESSNAAMLTTVWDRNHGAVSDHFRAVAVSGDQVWAGAAGSVAVFDARQDGDAIKPRLFSGSEGLGDSIAASIAAAPDGTVWFSHGSAIVEADRSTLAPKRRLTRRDGLIDGEVWGPGAMAFGADGRLWVATPRGVSIVDVAALGGNGQRPEVRIERVVIERGGKGQSSATIDFSALSYRNEESLRFRTRLAGGAWSEWSGERSVRFPGLAPAGKPYVLEIDACDPIAACDSGAAARFEFSVPK
jgi:ligand-binding sensor domain-containing protein